MPRNKLYLPIGKDKRYNLYHETYDRIRLASDVLNGGNKGATVYKTFWDRAAVQNRIFSLTGDEKGVFSRITTDAHQLGSIPEQKKRISDIEEKFHAYQKRKRREGNATPTEYPVEMLNDLLVCQATLDIRLEELHELEDRLKNFTGAEEIASQNHVLASGLEGIGQLRGGILIEIDGQKVSILSDGTPFINDKRSPYNGISCSDYKKLVKEWNLNRRKWADLKFESLKEANRIEGRQVPIINPFLVTRKTKNIPPFPSWARNWHKNPPEEEEMAEANETVTPRKRKR